MDARVRPSVFDLTVWSNPWHSFRHDQAKACTEVAEFVGTREFDLSCSRPWTTIPACSQVIHYFLGESAHRQGANQALWMTRFTITFLLFPALFAIQSSTPDWDYPAIQESFKWESVYQAPSTEYGPGHRGVDFKLAIGSAINSPVDGEITFQGLVVDRNVITIRNKNGYLASFEPACSNLEVGDGIRLGEPFAWHCQPLETYEYHCETCVHFSIRSQWGYLSPEYFLRGLKPSVLRG